LLKSSVKNATSIANRQEDAELDGYGRVLWLTKDVWPNFISCVLAVHEDMIKNHRGAVQRLVDGIAKSGKWIDKSMDHRMDAAQFVANFYYNQNPKLLAFVLSKPPDRVKYTNRMLRKPDFEEIEQLGREAAILKGTAHFEDYTDASFVTDENAVQPYAWEPAENHERGRNSGERARLACSGRRPRRAARQR
jgi:NitT/TauT family transport system substrate-binding protein